MALYMVGLGLGDEDDITVKGLKVVQSADIIFLEHYTSILVGVDGVQKRLEETYQTGVPIQLADRELVEQKAEELILQPILDEQKTVAFLVVGDPVCATTHTDLYWRAKERNIPVHIVHNASIHAAAAGATGLQLYKFGQTVSLPFFEENWKPTSFYEKIAFNRKGGLHTLCLLDIKVKEPDYEALAKKNKLVYLPPRFMTVPVAAEQLLYAEEQHKGHAYDGDRTLCVGLARMGKKGTENGNDGQRLIAGTLKELMQVSDDEWGPPLHSLVICGYDLHELEVQILGQYLVENSKYQLDTTSETTNVE